MAARLRTGDTVVVISGKDKGKTGKVARLLKDDDKVVVEGINLVKRHTRPTPKNPQGGIVEREQPRLALGQRRRLFEDQQRHLDHRQRHRGQQ